MDFRASSEIFLRSLVMCAEYLLTIYASATEYRLMVCVAVWFVWHATLSTVPVPYLWHATW